MIRVHIKTHIGCVGCAVFVNGHRKKKSISRDKHQSRNKKRRQKHIFMANEERNMYISEFLQPNGKQQFDFSLVTTYKFNVHTHIHTHQQQKITKDVT